MIRSDWLCIALTRTRGWEARDPDGDRVATYADVLGWAEAQGVLDADTVSVLRSGAARRPGAAEASLGRLRRFRAAAHELLATLGSGGPVPDRALSSINQFLPAALADPGLVADGDGGFHLRWVHDATDLDQVLWACVRSLVDLLRSPEVRRLKFCAAHDCGWIFIDASRNRSRRWCDMSDCGNRAKARRHRRKLTEG